jgi:hypothetical protein
MSIIQAIRTGLLQAQQKKQPASVSLDPIPISAGMSPPMPWIQGGPMPLMPPPKFTMAGGWQPRVPQQMPNPVGVLAQPQMPVIGGLLGGSEKPQMPLTPFNPMVVWGSRNLGFAP